MPSQKSNAFIRQYGIFYVLAFLFVLWFKYIFSRADSSRLLWILAPTTWWVRFLSRIPFEWQAHVGYISHSFQFVIASSCSGIQFMAVSLAALVFSFIHRMKTRKRQLGWMIFSLGASYLTTVLVNGLRIVLSIYLPLFLENTSFFTEWMTRERFHTMIGIAVYFTSLYLICQLGEFVSSKIEGTNLAAITKKSTSWRRILRRCVPPVFWYFFIILGIPFLNHAYERNAGGNYAEFATMVAAVCAVVLLFFGVLHLAGKLLRKNHAGNASAD